MLTKTEPLIEMTTGNVNNANIDCAMALIIICLVGLDGWMEKSKTACEWADDGSTPKGAL